MSSWMSNAMRRKKARAAGVQALADWLGGRVHVSGVKIVSEGFDAPLNRDEQDAQRARDAYYDRAVHGRRR